MSRTLPELNFSITFPNPQQNKVSFVPPFNYVVITSRCNVNYKRFLCRVTFETDNEEYGIDKGVLVLEHLDGEAGVNIQFNLVANDYLTKGTGNYRIGLYVESNDGLWNYYYLFTTISGSAVKTSDDKYLAVVAEGDVS